MNLVFNVIIAIWEVSQQMAPYLLLGFLAAGILSRVLNGARVERFLGGNGLKGSIKAALVGIPLPLCSCGVIPVTASLRKQGAGKGAAASFLTSTPQTGMDSILASYALMGWAFTIARVVAAFVTGVICGAIIDKEDSPETKIEAGDNGCGSTESCCESKTVDPEGDCCGDPTRLSPPMAALKHGFIDLPRDIGRSLVVGLILAGLITAFIPENFFRQSLGEGIVALLLITVVAVPLYVCSTGSIPFAFALMQAGISPGAALVFLITGPATNAVTISTVSRMLGKRATVKYLASLVLCAWALGWGFDQLPLDIQTALPHRLETEGSQLFKMISAGALFLILLPSLFPGKKDR